MKNNPDFVPATIEEAVNHIVENIDDTEREHILSQPSHSTHFGGGMAIRNDWSLWERDTPIKRDAIAKYAISHANDMSGLIFAWVWAKVRGEQFEPVAYCQRFHDHWAKFGKTSLQAGGVEDEPQTGSPIPLCVTIDIDEKPWTDMRGHPLGTIERIARIPSGTNGGKSAVAILIRQADGSLVMGQTTMALLVAAVSAFIEFEG